VSFETRKKANRFKAGYDGFTEYLGLPFAGFWVADQIALALVRATN